MENQARECLDINKKEGIMRRLKRKGKQLGALLLALCMVLTLLPLPADAADGGGGADENTANWIDYAADGFAGGTGTVEDPYRIETAEQFAYMAKSEDTFPGKYVILTNDLDLAGKNWTPVNFAGYFDGQGHSVSNMAAIGGKDKQMSIFSNNGLFGKVEYGGNITSLANIRVINPKVKDQTGLKSVRSGGIVGYAVDTDIINCSVEGGNISAVLSAQSGGIVGVIASTEIVEKCTISYCSSTAEVSGATSGGIAGLVLYGSDSYGVVYFNDCWSAGKINKGTAGGIIGSIQRIKGVVMENCFSLAEVIASSTGAGGLIGSVSASGSGQIIGSDGLTVRNCAALNPLISSTYTKTSFGRLVGNASSLKEKGHFSNNYADEQMLVAGIMKQESDEEGINRNKETFYTKAFWEDTLGFDFSENGRWTWTGDNYYPQLKSGIIEGVFDVKITVQPSDAAVYRNKDALFGIQVEGGSRNYQYQWQYSTDNQSWADIEGETGGTMTVSWNTEYKEGEYFRCKVSDSTGNKAVSESAGLSVVSEEYTIASAKESLLKRYQNKETLTQAREAFSLIGAGDDFTGLQVKIPFSEYADKMTNEARTGYFYWLAMDCYASGIDPRDYRTGEGDSSENIDIIAKILGLQNKETGGFKAFYTRGVSLEGVPEIILSLEMYFNGGNWGNEEEGKALGRSAAIEYFFSNIIEEPSGGKIFHHISTTAGNDMRSSQRMQAESICLLARLSDDPVYGSRAEEAMHEILEAMKNIYDRGEITYTENMARYVSALIAAASKSDGDKKTEYMELAETIIMKKLFVSEAFDRGYGLTVGERAVKEDVDASAAVMMALSDYTNGSCALADYVYTVSDAKSAQNDLYLISLPSVTLEDIELPDSGKFGSKITWKSSNTDSIQNDGKVIRAKEDVTVVLTAKAVKGEKSAEKKFTITVKADTDADSDAVDSALSATKVVFEAIGDIQLPDSPVEGVSYSWSSSIPQVLSPEGKVTRPSAGSEDASVIFTVSASKGNVTKTKDFTVTVYALTDTTTNEGMVKEGAYRTRAYFLENRVLQGYWSVWAAYSALGEFIQDPENGYVYDTAYNSASQIGAHLLGLVAMGENPYNYEGKDLVKNLVDGGVGGVWTIPVYNTLGLEAAGSDCSEIPVGSCISWMTQLKDGPDIGGWGAVSASRHIKDKYGTSVQEAIEYFKAGLSEDMASGSMGSKGLSYGCVVTGFTSFIAAGLTGYDVTKDSPWIEQQAIKVMYDNFTGGEEGVNISFNTQYMMEFCDLYNTLYKDGNVGWITCGASKEKVETQKVKAQEILHKSYMYTTESIEEINSALETVNGISEERLNASVADYGREYYALYDAVRYAQISGADSDKDIAKTVEEQINQLPSKENLKLADEAAVIQARQAYDALTGRQPGMVSAEAVEKLKELEAQIIILKRLGITISGGYSDDYVLNVEAIPENDDRYTAVRDNLTKAADTLNQGGTIDGVSEEMAWAIKNGKLLVLYNLSLFDTYLGEPAKDLGNGLQFSIPIPEGSTYDSYLIVHMKEDGTLEYVIPQIIDGKLVFSLTSLSPVGVIGYNKAADAVNTLKAASTGDESSPYLYIGIAALAVLILASAAVLAVRRKKSYKNIEK